MVTLEESGYCSCCGKRVIFVPPDITFAGTLHTCGKKWVRVDCGSDASTEGKSGTRKVRKKYSKFKVKEDKYIWRKSNKNLRK